MRPVGHRSPLKATSTAALLSLGVLAFGAIPARALSISIGETPIVKIPVPVAPVGEAEVSVGGKEQLASVSVEEKPVVSVPAPKLPSSEVPAVEKPLETPGSSGGTGKEGSTSGSGTSESGAPGGSTGSSSGTGSPPGPSGSGPSAHQATVGETPAASKAKSAGTTSGHGEHSPGGGSTRATGAPRSARRGPRAGSSTPSGAPATSVATPSSTAAPSRRAHAVSGAGRSSNPLDAIGRQLPLPLPVPNWSKPIILALLVLAGALAIRARTATRRARRLERRQQSLLGDVAVMQGALVPDVPSRLGSLALSVAYRPAEGPAAGGDFYDVFMPASDRVAVILGDVAGHGPGALHHAALARFTLRAYVQAGMEPRAALALAGTALADPSGENLATVAVGVYDCTSSTLTYALAGHPPPLVLGRPTPQAASVCSSPPIGWDVPTGRRQRTISLPTGARVCFFSDGLIEARCEASAAGALLGRERLGELLAELGEQPSAEELLAAVRMTAEAVPDDMAACILISAGTHGMLAVDREELEVDAHALEAGHLREFLRSSSVGERELGVALRTVGDRLAGAATALVRIERTPGGVTAEIDAPPPAPAVVGIQRLAGAPVLAPAAPGAPQLVVG